MLSDLARSMRPSHWIKNLFVAAPLVFSKRLFEAPAALDALLAVLGFCAAASAVYLVNDVADLERDRNHPVKRARPLPAGRVSVPAVLCLAALLLLAAAALGQPLGRRYQAILAGYFALNVAYSFWLKRAVIIDVMVLAIGFVLRVEAGVAALSVEPSRWLIMCTLLLALFLGFGKRRHELVLLEGHADDHREVLTQYSPYFLDQLMSVVTASTVMSYALYTIDPETVLKFGSRNVVYTTPFVLYGIFRYLYLVHQREEGGDPTRLIVEDRPLLINLVAWGAVVVGLIYW